METKIQLLHPIGKKAIKMDERKYNKLKTSILCCLRAKGKLSHSEILRTITDEFINNNINFEGSIEWHLEWVKLDLEARKEIKRLDKESPIKYTLT